MPCMCGDSQCWSCGSAQNTLEEDFVMHNIYVVVAGNVFSGIKIYGMFDSRQAASDWAARTFNNPYWHTERVRPETAVVDPEIPGTRGCA